MNSRIEKGNNSSIGRRVESAAATPASTHNNELIAKENSSRGREKVETAADIPRSNDSIHTASSSSKQQLVEPATAPPKKNYPIEKAKSSSGEKQVESSADIPRSNDSIHTKTSSSSRQQLVELEPATAPPKKNYPTEKPKRSSGEKQVESAADIPRPNDSIHTTTSSSSTAAGSSSPPKQNYPIEKAKSSSGEIQVESAIPTRNDLTEKPTSFSDGQKVDQKNEKGTRSIGCKQAESVASTSKQNVPINKATSSSFGQQVEPAAGTQNDLKTEKAVQEFLAEIINLEINVYVGMKPEMKHDKDMIKRKIHRYPKAIRDLDNERYTVPTRVAIGPYHRCRDNLMEEAEKKKHLAAYDYTRKSHYSVKEMYNRVVGVAADARRFYDNDVVAGISDEEFRPMMFYDACFLVQFMFWKSDVHGQIWQPSLDSFFHDNHDAVEHDVILLENQLPWQVVETVISMRFSPPEPFLGKFIAPWKAYLKGGEHQQGQKQFAFDSGNRPPHLLGLLRSYIVGRRSNSVVEELTRVRPSSSSRSFCATKLEEMGITLTAKETTTELIQMGFDKTGILCGELSMVPLTFDQARASFLINMAALELCMASRHHEADIKEEDYVVCSYLLLLTMLVRKEQDVQELQQKYLLRGGFDYRDAIEFFTSIRRSLKVPDQSPYGRIMEEIDEYKTKRKVLDNTLDFAKRNKKTVAAVFAAITVILGIIGTVVGILSNVKPH